MLTTSTTHARTNPTQARATHDSSFLMVPTVPRAAPDSRRIGADVGPAPPTRASRHTTQCMRSNSSHGPIDARSAISAAAPAFSAVTYWLFAAAQAHAAVGVVHQIEGLRRPALAASAISGDDPGRVT